MEKLILSDACFNGIKNTQIKQQIITPEHEELVKQANEKIKENRRREAETCINARNYLSD